MIKKKILLVLLIEVVIFIILCSVKNLKLNNKFSYKVISIKGDKDLSILENYVIGVVAAEMPATFSFEALKAQSVAARTFSYRKILDNVITYEELINDKGQSYYKVSELKELWKDNFDKYYSLVYKAVIETKGEILTYNNYPISAYYFSTSNGVTENGISVFKEEPYLRSVDSSWDKKVKGFTQESLISLTDFKSKFKIKNNQEINIDNVQRNTTNHVESITINDSTYSGTQVRKMLGLRSTDFTIRVDDDKVLILTNGYGHGVGMSQNGANYLAKQGNDYKEILKYYYTGVEISNL